MKPNKQYIWRGFIYLAGLLILALGITLNTKTNLGVSPIISVPFSAAAVSGKSLSPTIFLFYVLCVLLEWLLDRRGFRPLDFLQIPASFLTSLFIGLFDALIPAASESLSVRFVMLAAAVVFTGIGAALMVLMRLFPSPADALARVVGCKVGKSFGFGKNLFDLCCASVAVAIGLIFGGQIVGIGLGTVVAVVFTGRVIALVEKFFGQPLQGLAGLLCEADPAPDGTI